MFSPFERMVAWRYLRSKKAEGFVSVIAGFSFAGIMLGVATLIIVMSVMNGFRQELFSRILGLNGHMNVYAYDGQLEYYEDLRASLLPIEGIVEVTPMVEGQSLVSFQGKSSGILVRGIKPTDFNGRNVLRDSVVQGALADFKGHKVALGKVLAAKLKVVPGDKVTLTSPKVKSTPFGSIPRQRTYEIGMVFDVGMYEYNSGFIFMPLEAAQVFFQYPNAVTGLEVFIDDPNDLDVIRKSVALEIEGRAGVYDWRDTNQSFFNALQVERNVMFLILTLIIIVAAFNIISSMIMLVKDKGHDIAIMRTMGAKRSSMLKIFMLTGASIGFIGTVVGAAVGIAVALNIDTIKEGLEGLTDTELFAEEIYFLSKLPAVVDWTEVITVIGMAFILSMLATLYPAWRAARLDPVEALRYE
ncbi:MAG: ABC transporter permease [Micavibrio sp.]|nr:MAG: ABC transporter permease [Micavibrio sp.]